MRQFRATWYWKWGRVVVLLEHLSAASECPTYRDLARSLERYHHWTSLSIVGFVSAVVAIVALAWSR